MKLCVVNIRNNKWNIIYRFALAEWLFTQPIKEIPLTLDFPFEWGLLIFEGKTSPFCTLSIWIGKSNLLWEDKQMQTYHVSKTIFAFENEP